NPSFDTLMACTGVEKVREPSGCASAEGGSGRGGAPTVLADGASVSGGLPNAPHIRLNAPVSASRTSTRRLPYPSATNASCVLGYTNTSAGLFRFLVSFFPPLVSRPPICPTSLPALVNWLTLSASPVHSR